MSVYFTGDTMSSKRKPPTIFDIRKLIYTQSNAFSLNFVYCVFLILMLTLHIPLVLPLYSFHISIYAKASSGTNRTKMDGKWIFLVR